MARAPVPRQINQRKAYIFIQCKFYAKGGTSQGNETLKKPDSFYVGFDEEWRVMKKCARMKKGLSEV